MIGLVIFTVLPVLVAFSDPVSFQKLNAISESHLKSVFQPTDFVDIDELISSIPYEKGAVSEPLSLPQDRFDQSIKQGIGNCADFSFGAAVWLRKMQIDYEVVHFLPRDNFLEGQGHTIVRSSYELDGKKQIGLIDFLYGGVVTYYDEILDVTDIVPIVSRGNSDEMAIRSLSAYHNDESFEIAVDLSQQNYVLGRLLSDDINRYFSFVELIHFEFGDRYLEKLFVDGVSLLLGLYPTIYVDPNENLLAGLQYKKLIHKTSLWALRLLALLWLAFLIACISKIIKKGIKNKSDETK